MKIDDRISPLTVLLDEVLYKSTIQDLRKSYFFATKREQTWLLLSDYYFDDKSLTKSLPFRQCLVLRRV